MSRPERDNGDKQPRAALAVTAATPVIANPARQWLAHSVGLNTAIAAFCLLLIGAIWAAVLIQARTEGADAVAEAVRQNSNLAKVFEEHAIRTIKGLDTATRVVAHEYAQLGTKVDLAKDIADGLIDGKLFNTISVINESGDLVLSNKVTGPINYADRDHFKFHLLRDTDEFYISKPVFGRISGTWQIPMTRRINKQDGSFGGVVVISVDPAYFVNFYREADLGKNGLVMLTGLDGISRTRYSSGKTSIGADLSKSPLFKEQLKHGAGSFSTSGQIENVPRFVSYRTLADYPLIVSVGTSQEEVLAGFVESRNVDYAAALVFTAVIVAFAALLLATLARQRRVAVALAGSEMQFRATFEQAAVGIAHTSLDRRFLRVNRKFCDMLGYTRDEFAEINPHDVTHPDDRKVYDDYQARLVSGELDTFSAEARFIRKDGTMIWVNRTVSLVRDSAGKPLYFIRVIEDISERKETQERVSYLAQYDALTGLPNRNLFHDRLALALARAQRSKQGVALMFLDLDQFKEVNDAVGHTAGDEVLQSAAGLLRASLRDVDTIARLGGDEFTVILEDFAQVDYVSNVAEKIKQTFATPFVIRGREFAITVSIGISLYPHNATDAEGLLKSADVAMYQAKRAGRNAYEFYTPDMNATADNRLNMAALLRHALERHEFVLHYQPQVETRTGTVVGMEALIRWNSRELGLVPPAHFVSLAEETGLIVPIGEWVLMTACAQSVAWQALGLPPLLMSVNVSSRQLRQKNLVEIVAAALKESRLKPELLELEITETAIMENIHQNVGMLKALQGLGVKIAIDGFGTGHSSLGYLTKLPVHALKIDRSFIFDMLKDASSMSLVSTIMTMARSLRMKVIAEGVETGEQENLLRLLQCDEIQGFLISRPLPASEMTMFLTEANGQPAGKNRNGEPHASGDLAALATTS